jgi:hypothetical protein
MNDNVLMGSENFTEDETAKLLDCIKDCSDSLLRISAERKLISERTKEVSKELKIQKKMLNKIIKTHYKRNFDEEVATNEQFETLYESVMKTMRQMVGDAD